MSCRVFQRTMEHAMLDVFVAQCKSLNIKTIIGVYHQTSKNSFVAELYEKLGFKKLIDSKLTTWTLNVKEYKNINKYITVSND